MPRDVSLSFPATEQASLRKRIREIAGIVFLQRAVSERICHRIKGSSSPTYKKAPPSHKSDQCGFQKMQVVVQKKQDQIVLEPCYVSTGPMGRGMLQKRGTQVHEKRLFPIDVAAITH
jgi:hypothetical protein